jgi:hypothetical protein
MHQINMQNLIVNVLTGKRHSNGQFSTLVGQFSAKQNGEFSGGS